MGSNKRKFNIRVEPLKVFNLKLLSTIATHPHTPLISMCREIYQFSQLKKVVVKLKEIKIGEVRIKLKQIQMHRYSLLQYSLQDPGNRIVVGRRSLI